MSLLSEAMMIAKAINFLTDYVPSRTRYQCYVDGSKVSSQQSDLLNSGMALRQSKTLLYYYGP